MYRITSKIFNAIVSATPKETYENNLAAIALLKQCQQGKTLKSEDLDTLAKFNGWGSISQLFDLNPTGWSKLAQTELKEVLGTYDYNRASESIVNAHYTSPSIVSAIWELVKKLGFSGGRILEPSCGVGYFLGLMPEDIYRQSEIIGIEIDPTSATIASNLYPEAKIYAQGFETVHLPDRYFDLAIGNVPFGNYGVADSRYDFLKLSIHNYFLAKLTDLVRPGGFIILITSPYTLDAPSSESFRQWLAGKAVISQDDQVSVEKARVRLHSAIRLPSGVFKANADTMVSPDILVLQRTSNGIEGNPNDWVKADKFYINTDNWAYPTEESDRNGGYANLNVYFADEFRNRSRDKENIAFAEKHSKLGDASNSEYWLSKVYPKTHYLLGVPAINQLYGSGFALESDNRNLADAISKIASELTCRYKVPDIVPQKIVVPPSLQSVKNLSFCKDDTGTIYQRHDGELVSITDVMTFGKSTVNHIWDRIEDFWKLRKMLEKVIDAQSSPKNLANYQQALKIVYDHFTSKWGKVNDRHNLLVLGNDPTYYLVRALEKADGSLSDIFSKRVARQYKHPSLASNPIDALSHSLNTYGKLDLPFMSRILGDAPIQKIVDFLEAKNAVFFDTDLNNWVLADQYLSGNVYQKLQSALKADLPRNIESLKAVQPSTMLPNANDEIKLACLEALDIDWNNLDDNNKAKVLARTISVKLGANWIPSPIYQQFAYQVLRITVKPTYLPPPIASFTVDGSSSDIRQFGTSYLDSSEILERVLNGRDPRVVVRHADGEINLAASNEATEDARGKAREMKLAFLDWIWQDKARAMELCCYYNQNINVSVERKFNGSWLQLPGSNPDIQLKPWQLNAVARILENKATFLAHDVGLGKSFVMIASIMECRRLGLAKKPMMVVLNGTEKQLHADWLKLYPMANVLLPSFKDAEGRKLFTAQIATSEFDGVILTHSQFFSLAMSPDYQLAFLQQEKDVIGTYVRDSDKKNRASSKSLVKALKNVERRISKITSSTRKDSHIDFEGLTDMLVIDEVHQMKNLSVLTKMNGVRGIPTSYSQRATDSYMKILYTLGDMLSDITSKINGKVVGASGTILSNTMAEIFNWQRMFQLPTLQKLELDHFDAWASNFGDAVTGAEISPTGQYKVNTRFKSFVNLQVLKSLMGEFVDIVTSDMIQDQLEKPIGKFIDVSVQPSESQLNFLRNAVKRADDIKNRRVTPEEDNMLKITTDLTKAALSMRLMGEKLESVDSKLHECVWNVWQIWLATKSVKGTQLIFCDFSTPKRDRYNVYQYLRDCLVQLGIPSDEIVFIHDHDKAKRGLLFERVNKGEVRILLGSTGKLGTGCNVHRNGLYAMHHVDAPWRPSDIEQREGRGIRQGNGEGLDGNGKILKSVLVFRYITERLDALRWQTLQWKQEMIKKFMNGHDISNVEDCDQAVYSYAQVKSLATGNPLLVEDTNLRNELQSLLIQQRSHNERQSSIKFDTARWSNRIGALLSTIDSVEKDASFLQSRAKNKFEATFVLDTGDVVTDDPVKAGESFAGDCNTLLKDKIYTPRLVCKYAGFDVLAWAQANNQVSIILKRDNRYDLPLKFGNKSYSVAWYKPENIFRNIDSVLNALGDYLESLRSQLETARIEQLRCESLVGQSFPQSARIVEIQQRLAEIDAIMAEDEAALGVKASDDEDSEDSTDTSEDDNDFWNKDDQSIIGYTLPEQSVIDTLKARSRSTDWLSELSQMVQAR